MFVVATSFSNGIAAKLAEKLGARLVRAEEKTFPDGESYLRIPEKLEGTTLIVHSLYAPQDVAYMKLLMAIDAAKGAGADRVVVAIPYVAYARQDKRFLEGEPITVSIVLRGLETAGADALVTVDIHQPRSLDEWLSIPHVNVLPVKELADYFRVKLGQGVVLAPDKGALHRAEEAAKVLGLSYDYLEKTRDRVTGEVAISPKEIDVSGKNVLIIDDIISTGGTIALAARSMLKMGAANVYVACTHALLVKGALDRIYHEGVKEAAATDSVPSPISKVSVAEAILRGLQQIKEAI
ncbi:MAG: ribose-phosphate diphosphokinase [Thermoprotei archaeon]|nr:MAG: ribose-phosphate diphosphokinase [Thermoprotei archaeon]